ncbi:MAG: hypothetical protein TEF_17585 [Rhizobiales bacterium NRL2]|jgi:putative hemolysin|nr:MAG: hypothetical protein TEF_17585 [Rhizobiales bacterium NRL2]
MNRVITIAALAAVAAGLAACGHPEPEFGNSEFVRFDEIALWQDKETAARAAEHCAEYGKTARLVPDNALDGTVTYRCE